MPDEQPDRRQSIRENRYGIAVLTSAAAPDSWHVSGTLVDANDHGFRVRHPYAGFEPGEMVSFIHRFREGVARVIWNKAVGSEFETGCAYFEE